MADSAALQRIQAAATAYGIAPPGDEVDAHWVGCVASGLMVRGAALVEELLGRELDLGKHYYFSFAAVLSQVCAIALADIAGLPREPTQEAAFLHLLVRGLQRRGGDVASQEARKGLAFAEAASLLKNYPEFGADLTGRVRRWVDGDTAAAHELAANLRNVTAQGPPPAAAAPQPAPEPAAAPEPPVAASKYAPFPPAGAVLDKKGRVVSFDGELPPAAAPRSSTTRPAAHEPPSRARTVDVPKAAPAPAASANFDKEGRLVGIEGKLPDA